MSSQFEPVGAETKYEGKIFTVLEETFRHEDGEEATREIVRHKGAVGVVCHVYLATGLSDAEAETDEHERIDIETRSLAELDALIDEVCDAKTLIGLLELRRRR